MRKPQIPQHVGGNEIHVNDCHVWAEIWYLDSPTNYRESLDDYAPTAPVNEAQTSTSELQLLDELPSPAAAFTSVVIRRLLSLSPRAILARSTSIRKFLGVFRLV